MQSIIPFITNIAFLYFLSFINVFFRGTFIDLQFLFSTFLFMTLTLIHFSADKLDKNTKELGKFIAHVLFLVLCFSLLVSFLGFLYNILFYFGFTNSIIFVFVCYSALVSGLVKTFKNNTVTNLNKYYLGEMFLRNLNYHYNTYIISKKVYHKSTLYLKNFYNNYIKHYFYYFYYKFMTINNQLSANTQSKLVKNNLIAQYSNVQDYFFIELMQPYLMNNIQLSLSNNSFENKPYKNNIINLNNKDMDAVFLNSLTLEKNISSNINNLDDLDDLDDLNETDDSENILKVPQSQIDEAEKLEKELKESSNQNSNETNLSSAEKKQAFKKKLAEKKAIRLGASPSPNFATGPKGQKVKMPSPNDLMGMFQDEKFSKMFENIPFDKKNIDATQIKKILQSMQ